MRLSIILITLSALLCYACNNDDEETNTSTDIPQDGIIQESYFNSSLVSMEIVSAELEDGTIADCYQIVFTGDGIDGDQGPYCPETINDIGGLAVYDGETNPGLRNIASALLNDMETDGWDIVDENGNVNVDDFSGAADRTVSNCLAAPYDPTLTFTYLIPVTPKLATSNDEITEIEMIGLTLNGSQMTGDPPSAVNGPAMFGGMNTSDEISFPSLDPCGGHPDPAGYYHAHFIGEVMNQVLAANNISEVTCTLYLQTSGTTLVGFAKDGYPIYAYADMPADLDECQGRMATTPEYPDGIYHYVASTTEAPNMPPCLKGIAARNNFQIQ
ncbi:MAG: YHYH protein [Bacteroidota bacterium]